MVLNRKNKEQMNKDKSQKEKSEILGKIPKRNFSENKKSNESPQEENYKINLNQDSNDLRIFQDYFYENQVDKSRVLPKSDQKEASLLDIPEYRELYKNFSVTLQNEQLDELDNIKHDVKENDRYYKYGLTAKNEVPFRELVLADQDKEENLTNTPNQNIFALLDLDKDSSYESLVLKFRNEYQHGKALKKLKSLNA